MLTTDLTRTDGSVTATVDMVIIPTHIGPTYNLTSPDVATTVRGIVASHRTAVTIVHESHVSIHTPSCSYFVKGA
jgi:hypothetical protein